MAKNEEAEDGSGSVEIASNDRGDVGPPQARPISLMRLFFACMVAGGVQYGWALQLSLLTPYTLGLSHALSSIIWLCGPIAGFVVQPIVGLWSDRCRSRFGKRRPFISAGCLLICTAVIVVGFSSDIGYALGDTKEHCQHGPNAANAIFCSWMAAGNLLGYACGSNGNWHKWFPFLMTNACCEACANLKAAFLIAVVFLLMCLTVTLMLANEVPLRDSHLTKEQQSTGFFNIFRSFKNLPPGMPSVLILSWFPFLLYDTDWMGREVYHGNPRGTDAQIDAYNQGVREGAVGLLLNSVVLGLSSFIIEPMCRKVTPRAVWVFSSFFVFLGMTAICLTSVWSLKKFSQGSIQLAISADTDVKVVSLVIFAALGLPLAVLFSVPFAVASQLAAKVDGGQGLCIGVLNISIVIPQVIIALGAGPWDAIFDQGNLPAFALASAFAFLSGVAGIFLLPKLSGNSFKSSGLAGMH
ncbi:hypothetical protein ZIOFF_045586 [Zingiber officinale]|uniref:Uncharacterized protein n=1 Tax=Zingiber officinale TaxID=94328 RepID=A0A8J5KYG4_ZINOF|nr:hypothetical protein ZIOFF_045586 [Zingiber officinale]